MAARWDNMGIASCTLPLGSKVYNKKKSTCRAPDVNELSYGAGRNLFRRLSYSFEHFS